MRGSILCGFLYVLLPAVGWWAGLFTTAFFFAKPEAERLRAANPGEFICGNQFLPVMFIGGAVGYGAGLWASWKISKRFLSDSKEVPNK